MLRTMTVRRLASVLCVCLFATATVVVAQPKKDAKPAKDAAPASAGSAAGSAAGSGGDAGSAVQMTEDAPPADMEGTGENPDAPRTLGEPDPGVVVAPKASPRAGYPVEDVLRPITLPQNMSEVSIAPHAQFSPYGGADALRARYGITRQIQLGLTYLFGGIYADKNFIAGASGGTKFHPGKAVGLDVTILLQNWLAIRVGVPVYISPLALSLTLGAPMKFVFNEKFALGGFDDLLTIKLRRFAPSFYQEFLNAQGKDADDSGTISSNGVLRVSLFGLYQQSTKMVLIGRAGLNANDFGSGKTNVGEIQTFLRFGFQYTPRKYLDVGASLGFDDMAHPGTFGPAGYLALRI
jgi:hypothetical protein